jgi:hypothetical protein
VKQSSSPRAFFITQADLVGMSMASWWRRKPVSRSVRGPLPMFRSVKPKLYRAGQRYDLIPALKQIPFSIEPLEK